MTDLAGAGCGPNRVPSPSAADFEKVTLDDDTQNPFELDIAPDGRVFYIERNGQVRVWKPTTETTVEIGTDPRHHEPGERAARPPAGARLHDDGSHLPELLGVAGQLEPEPSLALHGRRRRDPGRLRGDHLHLAAPARAVLPHRRLARLRARRQPLHLDGRQQQPVRVRAASRRSTSGPGARPGTPSGPLRTRTTRTARSCGSCRCRTRAARRASGPPTRSRPATCSTRRRTRRTRPCPRSTRWASATRSGSRSIRRRAGCCSATTDRTRARPSRTAARRGASSSTWSTSPASTAGPTACATTFRTTTSTSRPASRGRSSTAPHPVNNSPNNTGLTNLPPAQPATTWHGYTERDARFPYLGTGGAPTGGPRYDYDPANPNTTKFPEFYDGKWFIGEWNKGWIKTATLNDDGSARGVGAFDLETGYLRPMDIEFGPDGSLYVIEWGSGFGGNNLDSGIYRIDYVGEGRRPIAQATATPGQRPGAADRPVLERGLKRSRRHAPDLRLGLRRRRDDRLDRSQPELRLHHRRELHGDAAGDRRVGRHRASTTFRSRWATHGRR